MRSAQEFGQDLSQRIEAFESAVQIPVDDLLREEMGVGPWLALGESPSNYSHPIARAEAHGPLTFISLAVPSSLHNGLADFTNVLMLAHPRGLLTVIRDPLGTFAAAFGGLLLADYNAHQKGERTFTAGEAAYRAVRACVLSLETSLTTLRAVVDNCFQKLRAIELREQRVGQDLDGLEAEFGKTLAELRAMTRTPAQILAICDKIEQWSLDGLQDGLFDMKTARRVNFLKSKVAQVEAIMGTFVSDIERAIKRCDDVSKRELLDAQRNNTYWTSALLLPNLVYAFFGQSFLGNARESTPFWVVSGAILIVYGAGSAYFLLYRTRRRWWK